MDVVLVPNQIQSNRPFQVPLQTNSQILKLNENCKRVQMHEPQRRTGKLLAFKSSMKRESKTPFIPPTARNLSLSPKHCPSLSVLGQLIVPTNQNDMSGDLLCHKGSQNYPATECHALWKSQVQRPVMSVMKLPEHHRKMFPI